MGGRAGRGGGAGGRLLIGRLIQPANEPPFMDKVIFVTGDVGVEINVTQSNADARTGEAVDISTQVADLAR
jgi:hypothetical protein